MAFLKLHIDIFHNILLSLSTTIRDVKASRFSMMPLTLLLSRHNCDFLIFTKRKCQLWWISSVPKFSHIDKCCNGNNTELPTTLSGASKNVPLSQLIWPCKKKSSLKSNQAYFLCAVRRVLHIQCNKNNSNLTYRALILV